MRAQFLGTAASEGYPDAFCGCRNCRRAREVGGASLRCRSSLLIDDELLIDLGPDLLAASAKLGVALDHVAYCLQTHEHDDHLHPANFLSRSRFCGVQDAPHLHFYSTRGAQERARAGLGKRADLLVAGASGDLNLTLHAVEPFQTLAVGPYRVTAVPAAHDPSIVALLYIIERAGRSLFYATDTGPLPEATRAALRRWGGRFDTIIMDHTFGVGRRSDGHLNSEQFREELAHLRADGLLTDETRVYATHLAHHSNPGHEELVALAVGWGYAIAYDGLVIAL